jgi:hypothetical protein
VKCEMKHERKEGKEKKTADEAEKDVYDRPFVV